MKNDYEIRRHQKTPVLIFFKRKYDIHVSYPGGISIAIEKIKHSCNQNPHKQHAMFYLP